MKFSGHFRKPLHEVDTELDALAAQSMEMLVADVASTVATYYNNLHVRGVPPHLCDILAANFHGRYFDLLFTGGKQ